MSYLTSESSPAAASPNVRSLVTFLLVVHFFFLLVGIKSNTSSSGLEQDLKNKTPGLTPYLEFLNLDLSYMFHYTYYMGPPLDGTPWREESDTDFVVEVDVPQPGGGMRTTVWPATRPVPGIRFRRAARFAQTAAETGESEFPAAPVLAQALARRIMFFDEPCAELTRQSPMVVRIRRRELQDLIHPEPQQRDDPNVDPRDPSYLHTAYEFRAFLNDDGDVTVAEVKAASGTAAPQAPTSARTQP